MSLLAQITKLKEKRAKLIADARAAYEAAQKDGWPDSESRAKWEAMVKDAESLGSEADTLEKQEKIERSLLETVPVEKADAKPEKPEEVRSRLFAAYLRGGIDAANAEARALQADSDTVGGYTVAPAQWVGQLIKAVDNATFMRGLANVIPVTSSDEIVAPSLDADPADPAWTAEVGAVSEDSTMAFGQRSLKPYQLTKLIKVSKKLISVSALPIESLVQSRLAYKFGVTEEAAYLTGSGAAQPLGVFTASALGISTGRDVSTGNSTTAIAADNLIECKYTLKSQYWPAASWIFHRDAVKQIAKLKDGDGQYMWQPGLQAGQPDRLLSFPVNVSEYAPNTFTASSYVGLLGAFNAGYWIAELQAMQVQRLVELYAANGQVGFIGTRWLDGMPVLEEAFVRVKLAAS